MANRQFRPFGDFLPDRRLLLNDGLLRAYGVTPVIGNYIPSPGLESVAGDSGTEGDTLTEVPYGLGIHQQLSGATRKIFAYYGSETKLYEIDIVDSTPGVLDETDRSRLVGGAYAFTSSPPLSTEFWWFVSYGDSVIATNLNDEVQFLQTPGSGNFEDMITSTFKPQGRIAFVVKQNLFLAYCFLPATYDGIPAGTHQQLVVWSMNDNIQAFGSESVDPTLIGADYQRGVGGDLGPITAAVGGEYGLIFLAGGIVRVDGPPYEFRAIVLGDTTLYPYSVCRLGGDVYFWGAGGPSVLRGGEAPVVRLGNDQIQRSLLDNVTSFGADFSRSATVGVRGISGSADAVNGLARFSYDPISGATVGADVEDADGTPPTLVVDASLRDQRLSVSRSGAATILTTTPRDRFLRTSLVTEQTTWGPFGSVYALQEAYTAAAQTWRLGRYQVRPDGIYESGGIRFQTGYGRLDDRLTTRIVAVRIVWSQGSSVPAATTEKKVRVTIHSRNKPWELGQSSSLHSEFNTDGWIGTDSSVAASYHSIEITLLGKTSDADVDELAEIHEFEGVEIQYITGGEYGT